MTMTTMGASTTQHAKAFMGKTAVMRRSARGKTTAVVVRRSHVVVRAAVDEPIVKIGTRG